MSEIPEGHSWSQQSDPLSDPHEADEPKTPHRAQALRRWASANFAGVRVDSLTMEDTLGLIREHVEAPGLSHHAGVNASKLMQASHYPRLRRILDEAAIVNADGMSVVWASRLLGTPLPERVTGIDTVPSLLAMAAEEGWPIFLLGAKEEVVSYLARILPQQFPGLRIAGYRNGYWTESEEPDVVTEVARSEARILLLGLPSPQKEFFVDRHKEELSVNLAMGIGGAFDVMSGRISRAPRWMQRSGLEWLYRLSKEPRRLWHRYTVENTQFVTLIAREWMRQRRTGG